MKMIDPTAMSRFTALREAAGKIDRLVPHVRLMEQPPHESRDTASVALEFPTPLVVLNSTIRQALSFLFSACSIRREQTHENSHCNRQQQRHYADGSAKDERFRPADAGHH